MVKPGQVINGCYKLQEKVGEDRFFATWRATALYSPNSFSLTFLTFSYKAVSQRVFDEFRRLFLELYAFHNPYILTPFEYDESGDIKFLASNWLDGYSLREAIDNGDFSERDQVVNTTVHLLRGLSELERIGVRHNVLSPKSLHLNRANTAHDTPRIRNVGLSLFLDALGTAAEYRDLPRYRKDALQETRSHERDLYSTGAIIAELVSEVEKNSSSEQLSKLAKIGASFREQPGSFSSIADALSQVLTLYPEKRTIDLIQEHTADVSSDDTMTTDLYRSIEMRYEATRQSTYEPYRNGMEAAASRRISFDGRPPEHTVPDLESDEETAASADTPHDLEEVVELLPIVMDDPQEGLLARALSAVRRFFFHRSRKRNLAAPAEDMHENGAASSEGDASDTDGSRGHAPDDGPASPPSYAPRSPKNDDKSRIFDIFRRLSEHFLGTTRSKPIPFRFDSRSRRSARRTPMQDALDARSQSREAIAGTTGGGNADSGMGSPRDHGDEIGRSPNGETGARDENARWEVERDAATENKEYDFHAGPEYSPGERRDLDDESGALADIDFGSSAIRTDRVGSTNPDPSAADTGRGAPDSAGGSPARELSPHEGDSATEAGGGPAAAEATIDRNAIPIQEDGTTSDPEEGDAELRPRRQQDDGAETTASGSMRNRLSKRRSASTEHRSRRLGWFRRLVSFIRSFVRRVLRVITRRAP